MVDFIDIDENKKDDYNNIVNHPLQSYEWGEFRKKTGAGIIRQAKLSGKKIDEAFCLTLHKTPFLKSFIGYLPKGNLPTNELLTHLLEIGRENKCIFIQLEPNTTEIENLKLKIENLGLVPSAHPLFTKFTFILDITKNEDELLKDMHPKTRYNIKVAQKYDIEIVEDNSEKGFDAYQKLLWQTTNRQGFYAHTPAYHKTLWETLPKTPKKNELSYHLFHAKYKNETITSWVLFVFGDTLYYPYGASSRIHREKMASNLLCWEAIKFGKKLGLTKFDMWGALGPNPDKNDPWYGFHRFKEGYGGKLTEFVGSYDLVINPILYQTYKIADKLRWAALKFKKR